MEGGSERAAFLARMDRMLASLRHKIRLVRSRRREKKKVTDRSPQWPAVRDKHIATNPHCAACGGTEELQVHHEQPYHLHPELELDEHNLITLCMGPLECHLRIGHGDNFKAYNPNVVANAIEVHTHPHQRESVEASAKLHRLT